MYRGTSSGSLSFLDDAGTTTSYVDAQRLERHDLLLQGVRGQRERRGRALERGLRDARRPRHPGRAAPHARQLQPPQREPALGRRALGERRSAGRRETGLLHDLEHARLLEDDDLHGLAQRRPVRPRRRGLGAHLDRCRHEQPASACTRACSSPAPRATTATCCAPTELAGTDQVLLERIDNGAIVNRLTVTQELAVGDVLLLRVKGSTLEVWRHAGSTWSRLGVVADATYAAAGYAGVGMRGTTGRLDDFGARTMGAPPPDTEPPSARGNA